MVQGGEFLINHLAIVEHQQLMQYSPIVLAYIGDAVFELMVRTRMVGTQPRKVRDIHRETVDIVKAESQARALRVIYPELSEQEQDIVRRGRNAKSHPGNRNNDLFDYKLSTGFEALMGYLYLNGDEERLTELVNKVMELVQIENSSEEELACINVPYVEGNIPNRP